jgi:hypothetical protein
MAAGRGPRARPGAAAWPAGRCPAVLGQATWVPRVPGQRAARGRGAVLSRAVLERNVRQRTARSPAALGQDRGPRRARAGTPRPQAARVRAVRGMSRGREQTARARQARRARQRKGRMPVAARPAAWRPGVLGLAVLACGIRGRTGRTRKARQHTIRILAVPGRAPRDPAVPLRATWRRGRGRARRVQRLAARLAEVPGWAAWMPEIRGRPDRTAGVLGRRAVQAGRAPRSRAALRAGVLGRGMAARPGVLGKRTARGRGRLCRNQAGDRAG